MSKTQNISRKDVWIEQWTKFKKIFSKSPPRPADYQPWKIEGVNHPFHATAEYYQKRNLGLVAIGLIFLAQFVWVTYTGWPFDSTIDYLKKIWVGSLLILHLLFLYPLSLFFWCLFITFCRFLDKLFPRPDRLSRHYLCTWEGFLLSEEAHIGWKLINALFVITGLVCWMALRVAVVHYYQLDSFFEIPD